MRHLLLISTVLAVAGSAVAQPAEAPTPPAPIEPAPPVAPAPIEAPAPRLPAAPVPQPVPQPVRAAPAQPVPVAVAVSFPAPVLATAHQQPSTFAFQIGGGYLSAGTVYVDDSEMTQSGGTLGTVAIDAILVPRLSMGLFAVASKVEIPGNTALVSTVGGTIKTRFGDPHGVQLRVGIAFGYQTITVGEAEGAEPIKGFDVAPIVELSFASRGRVGFVLQASALSQPVGGNSNMNVTFAPISYAAALIEIRN